MIHLRSASNLIDNSSNLPIEESIQGLATGDDFEPLKRWAEEHIRMIRENLASDTPYDSEWSLQRIQAIERILDGGQA